MEDHSLLGNSFEIDELLEVYSVGYCKIVVLVIWFVEGYLM